MQTLRGWAFDKASAAWDEIKKDKANHAGKTDLTTMDDGLEAARRYLGLRAPFLSVERVPLAERRQALSFRTDFSPGPIQSFVIEAMVIGFVYMLEQLLEASPEGAEVHFQGAPPPHATGSQAAGGETPGN